MGQARNRGAGVALGTLVRELASVPASNLSAGTQKGCWEASVRCKSRTLPDVNFDLQQISRGFQGSSHLCDGLYMGWPGMA